MRNRVQNLQAALISRLSEEYGVPVYTRRPRDVSGKSIRVQRTGGTASYPKGIDQATVLIEVWDSTDYGADEFAAEVASFIADMSGDWLVPGMWVWHCDTSSPVGYDDGVSSDRRAQFNVSMKISMEVVENG